MEREKVSHLWTNEKHSHYLDAMEASFVRTMLEDPGALRLHRYMPDSYDSTQDSKSEARNKYTSSSRGTSKMDVHADNRWERHAKDSSNVSSSSALDQVVPQMSLKGDKI